MRHGLFIAAAALLATACSLENDKKASSKSSATAPFSGGLTVADAQALPTCDASHNNALVYVTSTKTFEVCSDGAWSTIDLQGAKGDKGDKGVDGASTAEDIVTEKAIDLYKTYRRSVFRATLTCQKANPYPGTCATVDADGQPVPAEKAFLGSSFLCGSNTVCTNGHVVECDEPGAASPCYVMENFSLQALANDTSDSLNTTGTPVTPFFSTTTTTPFKFPTDPLTDLVKITVTGLPAGLTALPLAKAAYNPASMVLKKTLSLSYPLGFQDMYTDVGFINTPDIGECNRNAPINSGYQCPADYYDFSTSNDTDHGSSGSPLFDIEAGTVIGVTSAGTDGENANYTWAIDASRFSGF